MEGPPFIVSTLVNRDCIAHTLIDTGCLSYGVINSRFAQKHNLQRIRVRPRTMTGYDNTTESVVDEVAAIRIDIDGHVEEVAYFYIVPKLAYDMILGLPWIKRNDVRFAGSKPSLFIRSTRKRV
jgi:predicted aspartyl protease